MKRAIAIMAKQPEPGRAKTRMIPVLGADRAARLSTCMIADTVRGLERRGDCAVFIAVDSADATSWFAGRFDDTPLVVQRGQGLGERLTGVMSDLSGEGFDQVWAIGSDSPDLPGSHLSTAFDLLADDVIDLVFGPADDGGYYLVGWKEPWPVVLSEVEMSTPTVLDDSLALAKACGARASLAPRWFDVDEPVDLERLGDGSTLPVDSETRRFLLDELGRR